MAPGYSNLHDNGSYASMHDMNPPYNQGNPSYGGSAFHQQPQQQEYGGYSDYQQQYQQSQPGYPPYGGDNGYSNGSRPDLISKESYGSNAMGAGALGAGAAASGRKQQQTSAWMEGGREPSTGMSKKAKWFIAIGVLLVLAGIGGGIAAWQIVKKNNDSSSSSSSVGSTSKNGGDNTAVSGDPSKFTKDPNLKQSFYAMAYSPTGSILPTCGANLAEVQRDMQLLSQLTTRIRTYGSDCNASTLVMQAIEDTKVDMTVWLGIYIDTDDTIWARQRDDTLAIIQKYGTAHISGITVGNEFLLNTEGAASSYTSIAQKVTEFKAELAKLNLDKTIPVGTADAGSMITAALSRNVDYVMANVHPWFGGVPIEDAAGWTWEWQETNVVSVAGNTPAYIAETGWPTESMTAANATLGAAVAGVAELQTFLDTYVCQANANQSAYFYFEPFDEPWKQVFGGVEPYWGLFDKDRNLKSVTIPDCKPGNY